MQLLGVRVGAPADAPSAATGRAGATARDGKAQRTARGRKQQQLAQQPLVYRLVTKAELGKLFDQQKATNTGWLTQKECKAALGGMMAKARQAMAETQAKEREGRTARLRAAKLMQAALRAKEQHDGDEEDGWHAAGTVYA